MKKETFETQFENACTEVNSLLDGSKSTFNLISAYHSKKGKNVNAFVVALISKLAFFEIQLSSRQNPFNNGPGCNGDN
jgi:hypothetical protein